MTVSQLSMGAAADQQTCTLSQQTTSFQAIQRQAFLHFLAIQVKASDQLRIEWIDPSGEVAQSTPYGELPASSSLCFVTQMSIAGFDAGSRPGSWNVRIVVNEQALASQTFTIAPDPNPGGVRITGITRKPVGTQETELTIEGSGFAGESVVHIAQYTESGGWKYLAALLPPAPEANRIVVRQPELKPGEYIIVIRKPDGGQSQPARLLIETQGGYKLPFPAGEPWLITQTPYGSFSHWNNSLHAWDIAPRSGRCIVAMRAGVAYAFDRGLSQMKNSRSFGNYITIQHDDGEFSHYAHLSTGTFVVKSGQRVEQGQALATVGNSGYTLGEGGGYHVHVHVTKSYPIAAQSIPFRFEDLPKGKSGGTVISSNASPLCNCRAKTSGPVELAASSMPAPLATIAKSTTTPNLRETKGRVMVAQWWNDQLSVPEGATALNVKLGWQGNNRDLDLHLVSPSGKHYGWSGIQTGYSGSKANPEEFHIPSPEQGTWRVSVEGMQGGNDAIDFIVEDSVEKPAPVRRASVKPAHGG